MKFRNPMLLMVLVLAFGVVSSVYAQEVQRGSGVSANCGDIIEGEITSNFQEDTFIVPLEAGDSLEISLVPIGVQLNTSISITGPTNLGVAISQGTSAPSDGRFYFNKLEQQPKVNSGILSASGKYTIRITNFTYYHYDYTRDVFNFTGSKSGGIGAYTLSIGCTLRDGTIKKPGDTAKPSEPTNDGGTNPDPISSGIVLPGHAPIDIANAIIGNLTLGQPFGSKIPPASDAVLGYTFNAAVNDILALEFTRASGNLNLGLVVLSADNKVVFQASLVTSSELTTKFTLPADGTYTIGIFRIDLLPPAAPEATAFQLTATLNP